MSWQCCKRGGTQKASVRLSVVPVPTKRPNSGGAHCAYAPRKEWRPGHEAQGWPRGKGWPLQWSGCANCCGTALGWRDVVWLHQRNLPLPLPGEGRACSARPPQRMLHRPQRRQNMRKQPAEMHTMLAPEYAKLALRVSQDMDASKTGQREPRRC